MKVQRNPQMVLPGVFQNRPDLIFMASQRIVQLLHRQFTPFDAGNVHLIADVVGSVRRQIAEDRLLRKDPVGSRTHRAALPGNDFRVARLPDR